MFFTKQYDSVLCMTSDSEALVEDLAFHGFGGNWTLIKLDALERYLVAFNTALQYKPKPTSRFRRIYIDAFAGTGECAVTVSGVELRQAGSAKRALDATPAFDQYVLIDLNERHAEALQQLADTYPNKRIRILTGDGNQKVSALLKEINWKSSRAVLFLDPYGMAVQWATLQAIANTQAIDVWYLFPLNAVCRQAAHDLEKVEPYKIRKLNELFGTDQWLEAFYKEDGQGDLFGGTAQAGHRRAVSQEEILRYAQERVKTLFPLVLPPLILPDQGAPYFALFFLSSNPSKKAIDLTKRIASHILKMHSHGQLGKRAVEAVVTGEDLF